MDEPEILRHARWTLRPLEPGDVGALVALWSDPEVTRYLGGPRDPERVRARLEERLHSPTRYDLWPVVDRPAGNLIGQCGLLEKDVEGRAEIEIVYVLARSVWGRGYATEIAGALRQHAFRELGLERVIALIDPDHAASERVALKIGMRLDREVVRPGGARRRVYVAEVPRGGGA